jgi:hypothetical protein
MAMCDGDFAAAVELAVGAPPPRDRAEGARREAVHESFPNYQPSKAELDEIGRDEEARDERLDESPITTGAERFATLASEWLQSNRNAGTLTSNQPLTDAIAVAGWDAHLIGAKLHRALHGRDEYAHGNGFADGPVQNDRNGSAKVALLSIRRSIDAWAAIAAATGDADALAVGEELRHLETEVERTFPDAWKFIRPGFDQGP